MASQPPPNNNQYPTPPTSNGSGASRPPISHPGSHPETNGFQPGRQPMPNYPRPPINQSVRPMPNHPGQPPIQPVNPNQMRPHPQGMYPRPPNVQHQYPPRPNQPNVGQVQPNVRSPPAPHQAYPPRPGMPQNNYPGQQQLPQHAVNNYGHQVRPDQLAQQMDNMNLNGPPPAGVDPRSGRIRSKYANDPSLNPNAPQNHGIDSTSPNANLPPVASPNYASPIPPNQPGLGMEEQDARKKVSLDKAPSAVETYLRDQQEYENEPFVTSNRSVNPKARTDFSAVDVGNANPKFLRLTTNNVPITSELMDAVHIPLALVMHPLAKLRDDEMPVPEADFGTEGPLRCTRCKGYINPNVIFIQGGRKYLCNLCRFENEVPDSYFCNLDINGRRLDADQRPELRFGSVDFVATKEFCLKTPAQPSIVFAIDVSFASVRSNGIKVAADAISNLLYGPDAATGLPAGVRVGIMTFDRNAHFYNLNPSLDQAQMLVVSDINEPFVPLSDGFLVDPNHSRHVIEPLLASLQGMFVNNKVAEAAFGVAIQCAQMALSETGGRIMAFPTVLPTVGLGTIKLRTNTALFGKETEKPLLIPSEPFYQKLGEQCVESGVSVDLFVCTNSYVDIANIGTVSYLTNGAVHYYPAFEPNHHAFQVQGDLFKAASRPFGFNGVLRLRCSDGLQVDRYMGNFFQRISSDVELAGISSNQTVTAILQHESGVTLDEKLDATFQVALLYTTSEGQRRIRVHNLSVPVTTLLGNVFKYVDLDTVLNVFAKLAITENLAEQHLDQVRETLKDKCVKALTSYRKNCIQSPWTNQMLLPENFKTYPVLLNSLLKTKGLRRGMDVSLDMRVHQMHSWLSMSVEESCLALYPNMFALHTLSPDVGKFDANGRFVAPEYVRLSYEFMNPEGAYIFEDGRSIYLWVGRKADLALLTALFGVSTIEQVDPKLTQLPTLDNPFNVQVHALIQHYRNKREFGMPFHLVRQQLDQTEVQFCGQLIEDKYLDNLGYLAFLSKIHYGIQEEVRKA